jgi:hypothetical protein
VVLHQQCVVSLRRATDRASVPMPKQSFLDSFLERTSVSTAAGSSSVSTAAGSSSVSTAAGSSTVNHPRRDDQVDSESDSTGIPSCWTRQQKTDFLRENTWLCVGLDGGLKCRTCAEVKALGLHKTGPGVAISVEWIEGRVKESQGAQTKSDQQKNLRKKIYKHRDSQAHKAADNLLLARKKQQLENCIASNDESTNKSTQNIFRLVYKEMKNSRSFNQFSDEIEVAKANGVDVGRVLHTNVSAANICDHIADEIRKRLVENVVSRKTKLALLIDESTTVSKKPAMIVYVRAGFPSCQTPRTFFLDIVELLDSTSEGILSSLLACTDKWGLTNDVLQQHLVSFGCDGAAVMLGRKSGVATRLEEKFPRIVVWHCSAHRLELAVGDAVKEVAGTNNFKAFMDKLYTVYSQSPKNMIELREAAAETETVILAIGRVLSTRWVASSLRAVRAVSRNYSALFRHFENASQDSRRDAKERQVYRGLAERLSSEQFAKNLALMHDALQELSDVSLLLQHRSTDVVRAHNELVRLARIFDARVDNPGEHFSAALEAIAKGELNGVKLHGGRKSDVLIDASAFNRSLASSIRERLLTTRSSNVSSVGGQERSDADKYYELLSDMRVLQPKNWPDNEQEHALYGDASVLRLCRRFELPERSVLHGFREYKDKGGKNVPDELAPLKLALETIPVSTAECERGFSDMNAVLTAGRSSLAIRRLSSIMVIRINGPPVPLFRPNTYVRSWLLKGRRSAEYTDCMARKKQCFAAEDVAFWRLFE